jgi:D-lactate dehydrogenase (cytochrome)
MLRLRRTLNWRVWRVPALTGSGISGKQQPVRYQRLRLLGTGTASGGGAERTTSSNVGALRLALGSVVLALGGYYVGAHSNHVESPGSPSKPVYGSPEDFARAIQELKTLLSDETVTTAEDQLEAHGFSPNMYHPGEQVILHCGRGRYSSLADICRIYRVGCPHSVVVYPHSTEDVVKIINVARKYRMPVIPYAGGTSLEGHFVGVRSSPPS